MSPSRPVGATSRYYAYTARVVRAVATEGPKGGTPIRKVETPSPDTSAPP